MSASESREPPDTSETKPPAEWPFLVFVFLMLALIVAKGVLVQVF